MVMEVSWGWKLILEWLKEWRGKPVWNWSHFIVGEPKHATVEVTSGIENHWLILVSLAVASIRWPMSPSLVFILGIKTLITQSRNDFLSHTPINARHSKRTKKRKSCLLYLIDAMHNQSILSNPLRMYLCINLRFSISLIPATFVLPWPHMHRKIRSIGSW